MWCIYLTENRNTTEETPMFEFNEMVSEAELAEYDEWANKLEAERLAEIEEEEV
jgi:hypothetical protein